MVASSVSVPANAAGDGGPGNGLIWFVCCQSRRNTPVGHRSRTRRRQRSARQLGWFALGHSASSTFGTIHRRHLVLMRWGPASLLASVAPLDVALCLCVAAWLVFTARKTCRGPQATPTRKPKSPATRKTTRGRTAVLDLLASRPDAPHLLGEHDHRASSWDLFIVMRPAGARGAPWLFGVGYRHRVPRCLRWGLSRGARCDTSGLSQRCKRVADRPARFAGGHRASAFIALPWAAVAPMV